MNAKSLTCVLALATILCGASCATGTVQSSTTSKCGGPHYPPCHPEVRVGQHGIGCKTFDVPDQVGPPSYLVSDIGKGGVPRISAKQIRLAREIQHYVHSPTLRFAVLASPDTFVIFDAKNGPCAALGYPVLNFANGNLYYEPGEAPGYVYAGPGDGAPTPGPWCHRQPRIAPCYTWVR